MIANIAKPCSHTIAMADCLPNHRTRLWHFTQNAQRKQSTKAIPHRTVGAQHMMNSGFECGSRRVTLKGRKTGRTMNRKGRKLKIHKIGSLAGMLNFNADHLAGSVEIEHEVGRDLLRVCAGAVLKLNIKRVGVGKIFESHG